MCMYVYVCILCVNMCVSDTVPEELLLFCVCVNTCLCVCVFHTEKDREIEGEIFCA